MSPAPVATIARYLSAAIRDSRGDEAACPLDIEFGSERDLIGHLARGRIDVALTLVERDSDRFLEMPLFSEGYSLAIGRDHPLVGRRQVAAEDLAGEAMIVRRHCEALPETSRFFTNRGIRPHFALRSKNDERVLEMVAAGLGVTVMPDSFDHPGVARLSLIGFDMTRTIGFAFRHETEHMASALPPFLTALAASLRAARRPPGVRPSFI